MKKLVLHRETLRVVSNETATGRANEQGTAVGSLTYSMDFSCSGSTCASPSNAVRCRPM
jgi:hypothetical protein